MTEQQIKEAKLILDFMGAKHSPKRKGYLEAWTLDLWGHGEITILFDREEYNPRFHSNWNWLMPVLKKIESVNEGVPQQLINCSLYSPIGEVYEAVVEFIEEYNKQRE